MRRPERSRAVTAPWATGGKSGGTAGDYWDSILGTLLRMSDQPYDGRVVIDWRRVADAPPNDFDWRVTTEPSGSMSDQEIARLLEEVAERI